MPDAPLILTLTLDPISQQLFNKLRQQYFPPERNYLDAHLTLFHHLPANEPAIISIIEKAATMQTTLKIQATEIRNIGKGVAYKLECVVLQQLHKFLQQQWKQWLTPQDKQKLWPHITVQNKVEPAQAILLKTELEKSFRPFEITGTGLTLFEYRGGPWKFLTAYEFDK